MAQTFSYKLLRVSPLPQGLGDDAVATKANGLYLLSLTGPASSVSDGMVVGSISTDITYISALWEVEQGSDTYAPLQFEGGTGDLASDAVLLVKRASTGKVLSGATDLSSTTWKVCVLGIGPNASAVD